MNDEFEYSSEIVEVLENVESDQVLSNEESSEDLGEEESSEIVSSEPFIDYDSISAAVSSALPAEPDFDSDLNDLPLNSVVLLIVALVLGILIIRSKR